MKYELIDQSIFNRRIDRRPERVKRLQSQIAEKKRARLQEEFSVSQLIELGFYDSKQRQRPFGVECVSVELEEMDADWYGLRKVKKYRIRLFPPDGLSQSRINKLNPLWNEESQGYYWSYQIYGPAMLWVALDLMSRLINLPCWDYCESIPLYWAFGNEKAREMLNKQIPLINEGKFYLKIPPPPLIDNEELEYRTKRSMQLRIKNVSEVVTPKAQISYLRHHHTPYDYLWQTSKIDIEEARKLCNGLIQSRYPKLF